MRWGHARRPSWFTFFLLEMGTAAWLSPFFGRNIEKGVDPHAALEDNPHVLVMSGFAPAIHQSFQRGVICIMRRPSDENGAIAQLGERVLCKHEVVGSIPSGSTISLLISSLRLRRFRHGILASASILLIHVPLPP